eukprot:TRINITY_DN42064_c0_g1_i1.p1 TRINITY_DN42064_c0_g1~~TRINITY_DN42064_c0_g1_i1.p1  ORF type:complete len:376 (-),score=61.52 TRINITY_DN42064_c0_g1_i1:97-1224(-)
MWPLWWSAEEETPPPPPPRSHVFVMRNGQYEPQNLMPVLPRPDILDFDGFVMRRGALSGRSAVRPPDLRQASLVKSPVSVRKCSVRGKAVIPVKSSMTTSSGSTDMSSLPRALSLSFNFDAMQPGNLSIFVLAKEVEHDDTEPGGPVKRSIELLARSTKADEQELSLGPAVPLHQEKFAAGLGQVYESPPLDINLFPEELLRFDFDSPRDIPVAVRLATDVMSGETEDNVHLTYVSLQKATSVEDDSFAFNLEVVAQKLQHGGQCFVLNEVFGAGPRPTSPTKGDAEGPSGLANADTDGNPECVICLSEPRDTAVLPCRHMCFCNYCAGIVRLQCDRCPVCRQKVQSLLQFTRQEDKVEKSGFPIDKVSTAAASA